MFGGLRSESFVKGFLGKLCSTIARNVNLINLIMFARCANTTIRQAFLMRCLHWHSENASPTLAERPASRKGCATACMLVGLFTVTERDAARAACAAAAGAVDVAIQLSALTNAAAAAAAAAADAAAASAAANTYGVC